MRHSPHRSAPFLLLFLCLLMLIAARAWGRDAILTRTDGKTFQGVLIEETPDKVTLQIAGINTTFLRSDIKSVEPVQTTEEWYKDARAKIPDDDLKNRYDLAYQLYDKKAYTLAQLEVTDLLKRFPDVDKLKNLARSIDEKIRLADEAKNAGVRPPVGVAPGGGPNPGRAGRRDLEGVPGVGQMLTDEQINIIRIYEVQPDEQTRPRVEVPPEVIDRLYKDYAGRDGVPKGDADRQAFRHAPGWVQLSLLFKVKARELYPFVRVLDDPPVINNFRNINQSYVTSYCGTVQCHGGINAGKFFLFRSDANSMRAVYTNYYILYTYGKADDPAFMIDPARPEKSYLLQYGLARAEADTPHPAVRNWEHRFRANADGVIDDVLYNRVRDWIANVPLPRQEYPGMNYALPSPTPAAPRPGAGAAPAAGAVPAGGSRPAPTATPAGGGMSR